MPVTAVRYQGMVHDFVMLNSLRNTCGAQAAMAQSIGFLKQGAVLAVLNTDGKPASRSRPIPGRRMQPPAAHPPPSPPRDGLSEEDLVSDHLSSYRALRDPVIDICDLYAFPTPEYPGRLSLIMTVFPGARPGRPSPTPSTTASASAA